MQKNKTEMNNSPFLVHFDNRDAIRQLIKKKKHVASLYKVRKKSLCNVTSAERAWRRKNPSTIFLLLKCKQI